MPQLFSYGTLQLPRVQTANFGRLLTGQTDTLLGWRQDLVEITDPKVLAESAERLHPILRHTGAHSDAVAGTVFDITAAELAQADAYEVDDYHRIEVQLASGARAWVYVAKDQQP
jgi:hypothetical protein